MAFLDDMFDRNSTLINDLNCIMNKINEHNNTTLNIFSNMKEQVNLRMANLCFNNYIYIILKKNYF